MSRILGVSENFPDFKTPAVVSLESGQEFGLVSHEDLRGKWSVFFFWPLDFTDHSSDEIHDFNKAYVDFVDREALVLGASNDSQYAHLAWRKAHRDLKDLRFPMLADNSKDLSCALGILHPSDKLALRTTYIVDPDGIIRYVCVYDLSVTRNVREIIRVLDALQSHEIYAAHWEDQESPREMH